MKVLTAIVIDTRRPRKDGKYPVKLRVTYNRKQRYYATNITMTQAEYSLVSSQKPKAGHKVTRLKLDALEQKANAIIEKMPAFDFNGFERKLHSNQPTGNDLFAYYEVVISELIKEEKLGTASNYESSMKSLKSFRTKVAFSDVTVEFLKSYELWMAREGNSISTVGIYLRPLRAILNRAIGEGVITKEHNYPFGPKNRQKYQIPASKNVKKALSKSQLGQLFVYDPMPGWEEKALDFWKFSYLANGMNMKDIANLRYKDIDGEYIRFYRAKSLDASQVITPITVVVTEDLMNIINKWGNQDKHPDKLIFPILNATDPPEKRRADLQQFIKMVNKYMKRIAANLGIDRPITTYYARHSFSTVLKRSGVDIQFISESLGHKSVSTTRSYLDSFEDDAKKDIARLLTNF
jgi:integrase